MTKRWYAVVAAALVAIQLGGVALAAPASEAEQQSRRSFEKAEAHFRAGAFGEALAEYQSGYDLMPLPGFLINIAQCQRRLGDLKQALVTYRKFVMVAPDSRFVPEVNQLIEELQTLIRDAENASINPAPAAEHAESAAEAPRKPQPFSIGAGDEVRTDLVTVPQSGTPQPSETRWWLWGTVAAAVVAGATIAVLALKDPGSTTVSSGSVGTLRR